jgi:anhydro-N-acetylmuramic acid kinase
VCSRIARFSGRILAIHEHAGQIWRFAHTLEPDDLVATTTELTARLVARDCAGLTELVAAGGGTRNPVPMRRITSLAPDLAVTTTDAFGLPSQAKESFAFALLGFLTWYGLPGIAPGATDARHASVLGSITPGHAPLRLPDPATSTPQRLELLRS